MAQKQGRQQTLLNYFSKQPKTQHRSKQIIFPEYNARSETFENENGKNNIQEEEEEEDFLPIRHNKRKRQIAIEEEDSEEDMHKTKHIIQTTDNGIDGREIDDDEIDDEELTFLDKSDRKSRLDLYNTKEKGPIEKYAQLSDDDNDDDSREEYEENYDFVVDDDTIDGVKMINVNNNNETLDIPATKFELAKKAVHRRVQSYKDSMVTSDVWLASFKAGEEKKESMDVYPNWKFQGHLFSDDSDLNDGVTFYLGSECYRKGELYHTFTHFETRMYNTVKDEVESTKRRIKTNRIITHGDIYDQMVETNFVHNLFREIKSTFVKTIRVYNLKGERYKIEDTSSEDEST
ncbi:hypothetical protein RO3G_17091 [Rhizopus delemar RA 99-880]|uniref:Uncharacterized protein n=1 Tax=Rhizopus delemar (strain RA 99-880 / ATCC MYA-4621 / FGSC 9543 / NRRL 43880) TaxID=246409 RepID=I1CV04_RHIO9|nr:hypothetical protein RO3G_17091 [Rhizopus delemar RA 99-880]|eukprot:EIE92284.1 hypothetical protein RO3G_17091 [Rhizopus delemar RA 99-880]